MVEIFGKNLKRERLDKGFTQEKLAELCNVSKTTICQWETNKQEPSIESLITLSKIFAISIDELVGNDGNKSIVNNNTYNNFGTHNGNVNY